MILILSAPWAFVLVDVRFVRPVCSQREATALSNGGSAVLTLGETVQPTIPTITNDLSPAHLRGRYDAVMAGAFQSWRPSPGRRQLVMRLGARFNVEPIAMLILGCEVMAFIALAVEHRTPDRTDGLTPGAAPVSRG